MSVDWEVLEMEFPELVARLDQMDHRIDLINSAIDRDARTMTNPLTRPRWEERRNRFADIACAIYGELLVSS